MEFEKIFKSLPEGNYTHGLIPRPTAVVCVKNNPFTVAHHTPVNKDPFTYAISVDKTNYSYSLLLESQDFSINFLPFEFVEQIHKIGKTHGNEVNKWQITNLKHQKGMMIESYIITDSLIIYECKKLKHIEFEDHCLFFGKVVMKHYKKGYIKPNKVRFTLFHGKNFYSTNKHPKKLFFDTL
ncbi:flavin reductase family protein [Sulfurihydrogenibium subterraneum]|uniref:flavin reductase family protein n=1 Tax=Sulfurihydrogenibium subterraneum TaxID=171121 RepID=UPI00068888F8|nr:flavin reductase family protein [Sulfurihydrogenibium subterraneum]